MARVQTPQRPSGFWPKQPRSRRRPRGSASPRVRLDAASGGEGTPYESVLSLRAANAAQARQRKTAGHSSPAPEASGEAQLQRGAGVVRGGPDEKAQILEVNLEAAWARHCSLDPGEDRAAAAVAAATAAAAEVTAATSPGPSSIGGEEEAVCTSASLPLTASHARWAEAYAWDAREFNSLSKFCDAMWSEVCTATARVRASCCKAGPITSVRRFPSANTRVPPTVIRAPAASASPVRWI